ncbi:MAG: hypothetical protein ACLT40_00485 [Fusobacterium sp.]
MYVKEMLKISDITIKPLTKENVNLVDGFFCGNDAINKFLKKDALEKQDIRTYLFIWENKLIGYFSVSASGISIMNGPKKKYNLSAIEIKFFAIHEEYHHMYFDKEGEDTKEKFYLSDVLLAQVIDFIIDNICNIVGVYAIILYSVPTAVPLYTRSNFKPFINLMIPDEKYYLEGCIPMFVRIQDIE